MHPIAFAKRIGDINIRESARQEISLFSHLLALRIARRSLTCGRNAEQILSLHPLQKIRVHVELLHAGKSYQ